MVDIACDERGDNGLLTPDGNQVKGLCEAPTNGSLEEDEAETPDPRKLEGRGGFLLSPAREAHSQHLRFDRETSPIFCLKEGRVQGTESEVTN